MVQLVGLVASYLLVVILFLGECCFLVFIVSLPTKQAGFKFATAAQRTNWVF